MVFSSVSEKVLLAEKSFRGADLLQIFSCEILGEILEATQPLSKQR